MQFKTVQGPSTGGLQCSSTSPIVAAKALTAPLHAGRDPNEQELVTIMSRLNELSKMPAPVGGTAALLGGCTTPALIAGGVCIEGALAVCACDGMPTADTKYSWW